MSSGLLRRVVWYKFTDVSEVLPASIIRAMIANAKLNDKQQTNKLIM
jgi:hypothetical protein